MNMRVHMQFSLLCTVIIAGCSETSETSLVVGSKVRHVALIEGEALPNEQIAFVLANAEAEAVNFKVLSKNCNCYNVFVNGGSLAVGESIEIAPGGNVPLTLGRNEGRLLESKSMIVVCETTRKSKSPTRFKLELHITTHPTMSMSPNPLVADLAGEKDVQDKLVRVEVFDRQNCNEKKTLLIRSSEGPEKSLSVCDCAPHEGDVFKREYLVPVNVAWPSTAEQGPTLATGAIECSTEIQKRNDGKIVGENQMRRVHLVRKLGAPR